MANPAARPRPRREEEAKERARASHPRAFAKLRLARNADAHEHSLGDDHYYFVSHRIRSGLSFVIGRLKC